VIASRFISNPNRRVSRRFCELEYIVVMEATGGYESLLVKLLHQHQIALAVVNPRQVRDFARGLGYDAKTDPH